MAKVIVIILLAVFIVGAICGNFHCIEHLCNTLTSAVSFVSNVLHTEIHGFNTIAGLF